MRYGLPAGICPEGYHTILDREIATIGTKEDLVFQKESRIFIKSSTDLSPEQLERKMTI
jgi:hypothetical protein